MMVLHYLTSPRVWLQVTFAALALLAVAQVYWYSVDGLESALKPLYLTTNATLRREHAHDPWADGVEDDLVWMMQISDLHISKFHDLGRQTDLRALLKQTSRIMKPSAVLVTGDITDSKTEDHHGSTQLREEWIAYHGIVANSGILNVSRFLDIRGNHDDFDVLSHEEENNFYRRFSVQGQTHSGSYLDTWQESKSSFGVVAIDASPYPGLKRPFNFFGTVFSKDYAEIMGMATTARRQDHALFMGHYPTSSITVQGLRPGGVRDLMAGSVYLCGHYHTAFNYNRQMFSRHRNGLLELELGDWKDNRRFRILTFDRDLLSFEDFTFDSNGDENSVYVVVSNPKNSMAFMEKENIFSLRASKSLRVLVFAGTKIEKVEFELDFSDEKSAMTHKRIVTRHDNIQPLYTAEWDAKRFTEGLHTLTVFVTLTSGHVHVTNRTFSLDGSQPEYSLMARIILMNNWLPFSQLGFAVAALGVIGLLSLIRFWHSCALRSDRPRFRVSFYPQAIQIFMHILRNLWLVSAISEFYWPLVGFILYCALGPLCVGQVLTSRLGVIFCWGIILQDGTYTPPDTVFAYAFFTIFFHFIFILVIGSKLSRTYSSSASILIERRNERLVSNRRVRGDVDEERTVCGIFFEKLWQNLCHLVFVGLTALLILNCKSLYHAYGLVSVISPVGIGRIIFYCWLYLWSARRIKSADLSDLVKIWG